MQEAATGPCALTGFEAMQTLLLLAVFVAGFAFVSLLISWSEKRDMRAAQVDAALLMQHFQRRPIAPPDRQSAEIEEARKRDIEAVRILTSARGLKPQDLKEE